MPPPSEAQAKAALLLNLPKYVDWPAGAFAASNSPLVVTVYGNDELAGDLEKLVAGREVNGHPIQMKQARTPEECTADCHILFLGVKAQRQAPGILGRLAQSRILTVGENSDFIEKGGVINLFLRERKVRLQVNLGAARRAGIQISSRLLVAADAVFGREEAP